MFILLIEYINLFFVCHGLPDWVKGCNLINSHHPTVVNLLEDRKLNGLDWIGLDWLGLRNKQLKKT